MIKSYFGLLIFLAVQHQASSLSADVDHRKHTQTIREDMMKELQNIQRRSDIRQDPIDNYDLIVTERSESLIKPVLRHPHGHHRLRSGKGAKVTIKSDNAHKPLEVENTLRRNFNVTEETNITQVRGDKNATTKNNLSEHQGGRENETTPQTEKDKYATTKNYLNENQRGAEFVATTQIQGYKNATTKNYHNENRSRRENEPTTLIQKDENATTRTFLNENWVGGEKVATTQIQEGKDAATKNDLNEHLNGRENRATTQIQRDKNFTMKNNLNEHRRPGEEVPTTQIQTDKNPATENYNSEHQRGLGEVATTHIQKDEDATTTNYLIESWREGEKIATTSQKPVKKRQKVTPKIPFYRRVNYLDDQERNKPQKWVHCLDLVGPRLKGYIDSWRQKEKNNRHSDIKRLAELLNTDVSQYTEAEIVALLSQISNIDIRLFQWDYTAITTIINIIIRGTIHSFRKLKSGVKYMFSRWHLDTSMLKTFLEQTRVFRPPCIDISGSLGYTKKAGGILLFTKPDKSTKKPRGGDESCHSREMTTVNNNNY